MKDVDDLILKSIENDFKTVKEISEDLKSPYVRISVRLKQLRKRGLVISMLSNVKNVRGVKPLKYRGKR